MTRLGRLIMSHNQHITKSFHGQVRNGIYTKTVTGSIHRLRKPPAWAVDISDLAEAERLGATRIEIFDRESGTIYTSTIENFRAHALPVNRGYGRQLALEGRHWSY